MPFSSPTADSGVNTLVQHTGLPQSNIEYAYQYLEEQRNMSLSPDIRSLILHLSLLCNGAEHVLSDLHLRARRAKIQDLLAPHDRMRASYRHTDNIQQCLEDFFRRYQLESTSEVERERLYQDSMDKLALFQRRTKDLLCQHSMNKLTLFHRRTKDLRNQLDKINEALSLYAHERSLDPNAVAMYNALLDLKDDYENIAGQEDGLRAFQIDIEDVWSRAKGMLAAAAKEADCFVNDLKQLRRKFVMKARSAEMMERRSLISAECLREAEELGQILGEVEEGGVTEERGNDCFLLNLLIFWQKWAPPTGRRFEKVFCFVADLEEIQMLTSVEGLGRLEM